MLKTFMTLMKKKLLDFLGKKKYTTYMRIGDLVKINDNQDDKMGDLDSGSNSSIHGRGCRSMC